MIFEKLSLQNGVTALYVASFNGHVEVVNILLQNGSHVDVQKEVSYYNNIHSSDPEGICSNGICLLTLGAHAQEGYGSCVCVSVCLSAESHLTCGASENTVTYSADNEDPKFALKLLRSKVMASFAYP